MRRQKAAEHIASMMTRMVFEAFPYQQRIWDALLDARDIHGDQHAIVEDMDRQPLTYKTLCLKSFVLSYLFKVHCEAGKRIGVLLPNTNATIAFTNYMRSHSDNAGNLFKAPSNDERQRLRLQLTNGTSSDEALVYFDSNAANNFDDYDSPKMMNNSTTLPDLYSKAGEERLVINGMTQAAQGKKIFGACYRLF